MIRLAAISLACVALLRGETLRQAVDRAMRGRAGAAVVCDVRSGRILAHYRLDVAARRLATPGSAVKPFTLLALLRSGAPPRARLCAGALRIAGRQMDCTHPAAAGPLDAAAALAYSCNGYFASAAGALRDADLIETFTRSGLSARTGWSAGEAVGKITAPANAEERCLLAIGEANILVTPLELLYAYRRLALLNPIPAPVLAGLKGAAAYGTARLAQPPGMSVAGKTGTSIDPAAGQAHAWFAGFAPAEAPRIVMVVFLEGGTGGRDAAPVARELFRAALPAP